MSQVIHQVRYGWSPSSLLGTRGMGPVESTLPADLLTVWDGYLRDHVWAASAEPGFTFIVREDIGALLRKVATPAADGRPGSAAHALLGSRLTARDALGLTGWDGWDAPALSELPWSALEAAAYRGLGELRARARALQPDRLAGLFAQLLQAPGEGYTVIGEPDPLAVTCALGDLIGQIPTFASDEHDDTGPSLPTAVFLREAPFSTTAVTRRRLSPDASLADPGLASFASAAVGAYAADGPDGIGPIRPARPPTDLAEARAWAQAAQFAPGVLADLARLPRLSEATLNGLVANGAIGRIEAAAAAASSGDLTLALDGPLPPEVAEVLLREGVTRVLSAPGDDMLLDRLAQLGPLPANLVTWKQPPGFDHLARVTWRLMTRDDRRVLLERTAQDIPLALLIRWIGEYAAADPRAALAGYSALCARAGKATDEDLRALMGAGMLVGAVRHMTETGREASLYLATLLRALPKRALGLDAVAQLANQADAVSAARPRNGGRQPAGARGDSPSGTAGLVPRQ